MRSSHALAIFFSEATGNISTEFHKNICFLYMFICMKNYVFFCKTKSIKIFQSVSKK